ncbi:hypothetical protein FOCC_FOCC014020 [Frankliniella occidentalis]|nr:hypothetical protein FOCC_FOCC014020 [Frankliniella occidentalis]
MYHYSQNCIPTEKHQSTTSVIKATASLKTPVSRRGSRGPYLQWTIRSDQRIPRSTLHSRKSASKPSKQVRKKLNRHPLNELIKRSKPTPRKDPLPAHRLLALNAAPTLSTAAVSTEIHSHINAPSPEQSWERVPSSGPQPDVVDITESESPSALPSFIEASSPEQLPSNGTHLLENFLHVELHEEDGFYLVSEGDNDAAEGEEIPDDTNSEDSFVLRLDEVEDEEDVVDVTESESPPDDDADESFDETSAEFPSLFMSVDQRAHILMLLATMTRHNLTYPAAEDIMNLAGVLSGQDIYVPSKHIIKRTIEEYSCSLNEHHMCPCGKYIGRVNHSTFECATCEEITSTSENKKKGNIFLYMSLKEQLEALLKHHSVDILKPQDRNKIYQCNYEDIYDGKHYRTHIATTSKKSAWPVLACLNELPLPSRRKHIFLISLWLNLKKPNCHEYLKPFVEECVSLEERGISFEKDGSVCHFKIKVLMGIADTIARPLLRNSTQFNGRYGCGLCLHPGFWMRYQKGHTRSYSTFEREYPLRTHNHVMQMAIAAEMSRKPQRGITGVSVLSQLKNFDMARCLDLDLFHALVNVAKRFAHLWFLEKWSKKPFSISTKFAEVNARLLQITPTSDVSRNPRSLKDRSDYRGHEWFHWVVDYSIPVLKGILPARFLNHWGLLVHGIALIMQNSIAKSDLVYASRYLSYFVSGIDHLYGKHHVTISVHLLTHIGASVADFGPPWAHSAFIFESFNAEIKQAVKSSNGANQQICKAMQKKIALRKLEEDVGESMTDAQQEYLKNVLSGRQYALPNLTIGDAALLGIPRSGPLPLESFAALRRAGVECTGNSTFLSYDRCLLNNEVYHSCNYSRVTKQNNSVVLLTTDEGTL